MSPLSIVEQNMSIAARALRFNRHPVIASEVARAVGLLATPPTRQKQLAADWERFQHEAFGTDARSFVTLGLAAASLMMTTPGGLRIAPRLNIESLPPIGKIREVVGSAVADRAELALELSRHTIAGIPATTLAFLRKPYVRLRGDDVSAVSPSMVRASLHLGLWARCLNASKKLYGEKNGHNVWSTAFGDMFEAWCLRVLQFAREEGLRDEVLPSDWKGIEIADIVLRNRKSIALISVKAKVVTEKAARSGYAAGDIVRWCEQFLFAGEETKHRGALRQLQKAVDRIRSGGIPGIGSETEIVPICVTFDDIGESYPFYEWFHARCRTEGLLQQNGVAPMSVISIRSFEQLLAVGAQRGSVVSVVREKVRSSKWQKAELSRFLYEVKRSRQPLANIKKLFNEASDELMFELSGQTDVDEARRRRHTAP